MGTERYYKPGSFYRICDKTGFATRAERTRMEWNGLIVDYRVFEPRQPQDFVKGVRDDQSVPYPRPRSPNPPVGASTLAKFQVYGDSSMGVSFEIQNGKIMVFHALSVVTAAGFPEGF